MDVRTIPVLSPQPGMSRSNNTQRSFEPRERMPVPGNPHAELKRPEISPGIIPVADDDHDMHEAVEMLNQIDELKKKSIDYQIVKKVLDREEDDVDSRNSDAHDAAEESGMEQKQESRVEDDDVRVIADRARENIEERANRSTEREPVKKSDPLAFDMDNNGIQTTGVLSGVLFDIDADGTREMTSFISGNDVFLALDKNSNGKIDNGRELFGDQNGASNGYEELSRYDDNKDNVIDSSDRVFGELQLLQNREGTLSTVRLADSGIARINLGYTNTNMALNTYDHIAQMGTFEHENGQVSSSADIMLGFSEIA